MVPVSLTDLIKKKKNHRGVCVVQLVKYLTPDFGSDHDLGVMTPRGQPLCQAPHLAGRESTCRFSPSPFAPPPTQAHTL